MSTGTRDFIDGAVILVPALLAIVVVAALLAKLNKLRYDRAFAPLIPVIEGRLVSDGNHAMITGTYKGRSVGAMVTTSCRSDQFPGHSETKRNILDIEMNSVSGERDWSVVFSNSELFELDRWHVRTVDQALAERLEAAGALEEVRYLRDPSVVRYAANIERLTYTEDIRPRVAPTPKELDERLQLLLRFVMINERANTRKSD